MIGIKVYLHIPALFQIHPIIVPRRVGVASTVVVMVTAQAYAISVRVQ